MSKCPQTSTNAPASKCRRTEISVSDKQSICQYKKDNPKCTSSDLIQFALSSLSKTIGKSTIYDILKKSEHWLSTSDKNDKEVEKIN